MSEIKLIKFKLNQNPLFAKKLDINEIYLLSEMEQ